MSLVAHGHWTWGIGVLVAFDAYLREGELLRLTVADVVLPHCPRIGKVFSGRCGLFLGFTKTGRDKFVEVVRPEVIFLLTQLVQVVRTTNSDPAAPLFSATPSAFLRAFKAEARALGFDPRTVVHSCRHGGATSDYLAGHSLEWIQHRGRWASLKSATHYIQMGRALLMSSTAHIPQSSLDLATQVSANVIAYFTLA